MTIHIEGSALPVSDRKFCLPQYESQTDFLNVRKIPLQAMNYDESSPLEAAARDTLDEMRKAILTDRDLHDRVRHLLEFIFFSFLFCSETCSDPCSPMPNRA